MKKALLITVLLLTSCNHANIWPWWCVYPEGPCYNNYFECSGEEWELERLDCIPAEHVFCSQKPVHDPRESPACFVNENMCQLVTHARCNSRG